MSEIAPVPEPVVTPAAPDFGAMQSIDEYRAARESAETQTEVPVETPAAPVEAKAEVEQPESQPDPASDAGKELAKKKTSLQSRINELTREKHETRREAETARAEAAALRAELAALKTPRPVAAPPSAQTEPTTPQPLDAADPEPTPDAFDTYDQYVKAQAKWEVRQELKAVKAQEQQALQQQAAQTLEAQVKARADKFRAEHPDYDEVVWSVSLPEGSPTSGAILAHLQHSDLGPALAYELGSNPAELARIASLAPGFAVAALGRLEAQIEARTTAANSGPASVGKPVTTAPDPIKPVGGSSTGASTADPKNMNSVAAWREARKAYL